MAALKYLTLIVLVTIFSCVAPKQPELTKSEEQFIENLRKRYNCKVERNIDVILFSPSTKDNQRGGYSIDMNLQCDTLLKFGKDSLKIETEAKDIAKQLYNNVLKRDPRFDEVAVS